VSEKLNMKPGKELQEFGTSMRLDSELARVPGRNFRQNHAYMQYSHRSRGS